MLSSRKKRKQGKKMEYKSIEGYSFTWCGQGKGSLSCCLSTGMM